MTAYAKVDQATGRVVNVEEWDDDNPPPDTGEYLLRDEYLDGRWGIGWVMGTTDPAPFRPWPTITVEAGEVVVEFDDHPDLTPPATVTVDTTPFDDVGDEVVQVTIDVAKKSGRAPAPPRPDPA